jgi:hypothetical protein
MIVDRMDALIRELDIHVDPNPAFVEASLPALLSAAGRARQTDSRPLAWLHEHFIGWIAGLREPVMATRPRMAPIAILALLVALLLGILAVGALRKPVPLGGPTGLVVIANRDRLEGVDIESGVTIDLLADVPGTHAVSRSPDGWLASYRAGADDLSQHLELIRTDGQQRRIVAPGVTFTGKSCNDIWSNDSRWLVAGVRVGSIDRILVVEAASGTYRFVTPLDTNAGCPIWSPDGAWIAYVREQPLPRSIEVVRRDGTGRREVTREWPGGPVSWSADGWIYHGDDNGRIERVRASGGPSERLSRGNLNAWAPALSPDGRLLSFLAYKGHDMFDLWLANSDGSEPHLLLANAITYGWSTDGRYLLGTWVAPVGSSTPGGLVIVRPDGSELKVLRSFDEACPARLSNTCFDDIGWGQSRP